MTKNLDYINVYVSEILRYALNDRVTVTLKLLCLLSQYVDFQVVDFFRSEDAVIATALNDDTASHFEEGCTFHYLVEILTTHYLAVVGQEDRVVVLHGFYYGSCQFRRTRTIVRDNRDFLTYVARYFGCYVEVGRLVLHASYGSGIFRLEVEYYVHVRTGTENTEVECTFHRWLHTVHRSTCFDVADRYLFLLEVRHP